MKLNLKKNSGTIVLSVICFALSGSFEAYSQVRSEYDFIHEMIMKQFEEENLPQSERKNYYRYLDKKYKQQYNLLPEPEYKSVRHDHVLNHEKSDNPNCSNAGFDNFNFDNWSGGIGFYPGNTWTNGIYTTGLNADVFNGNARHTIVTTPAGNNDPSLGPVVGYDPLAINPVTGLADIPLVAPFGSGVSVRLGNADDGRETEYLRYTVSVTPANTSFYYYFAIVLQDPSHSLNQQPFFKITVTDQNNQPIGGACATYYVNATLASSDTSFIETVYDDDLLYYRKWQLVGVDLQNYVGQNITITFQSADCSLGAHFGYAYIDAGCGVLQPVNSFCQGDTTALISAPEGFSSYQWYGPDSPDSLLAGETNDTLVIHNPVVGSTYYLEMISAAGCITSLQTNLQHTTLTIASSLINNSCQGGATGSIAIDAAGTTSGYTYLWTPGNYTTSNISALPAGNYQVLVQSDNPGCGTVDSVFTISEFPLIPNVQDLAYCTNPLYAVGPQGTNHEWFDINGSPLVTNDTLVVNNPVNGNELILTYNNTQGCRDSIVYTLYSSNANFSSSTINFCTATVSIQGPAGTNYQWYDHNQNAVTVNGNNQSVTANNPPDNSYYYLGYNSFNGCRDSAVFLMNRTNPVELETVNFCSDPTIVSGPAGLNFQWYDSLGVPIVQNGTSQDFSVSNPVTAMSLILGYDNFEGCRDSVIFTLNEAPQLLSASPGPGCGEATFNFNDIVGDPPYAYVLHGQGNFTDSLPNIVSTQHIVDSLGSGNYTVTIYFSTCNQDATFSISNTYTDNSDDIPMCFGDTVVFTPPFAGSHRLYNTLGQLAASSTNATMSLINPVPGVYIDTTVVSPACIEVTAFNVEMVEIETSTGNTDNVCHEGAIGTASVDIISGPAHPNTYSWTGPDGFSSVLSDVSGLVGGQYICTTRSGNCITIDTVLIYSPPLPADTLQIDVLFCDLDTLAVLHGPVRSEFSDYQWYFNGNSVAGATEDSLTILNVTAYEDYSVTYASEPYGCIRKTTLVEREIPDALFIPVDASNVFTPNGDGKNDLFYPFYSQLAPDPLSVDYYAATYEIKIYDRWGRKVFTSTDYAEGWDGKHNKTQMPSGVYFWVAKYNARCADDSDQRELSGFVQLLRE